MLLSSFVFSSISFFTASNCDSFTSNLMRSAMARFEAGRGENSPLGMNSSIAESFSFSRSSHRFSCSRRN